MRIGLLLTVAALALAACGEINSEIDRAKQGAIEAGQDVLNAGAGVLDTRTACLLAGQSEAFCGCLSERLGSDITPEHVEALSAAVRATLEGETLETASQASEGVDAATREALVQCATHAAIEGVVAEGN
ncbi:MAG: hypothetical protein JNJ73_13570 [Hyphomonadaceae bacterium]|nr:hypothetical protein [Hyphomonadaceae bacterium]